jgi:arylsulfatase A-like enzyme
VTVRRPALVEDPDSGKLVGVTQRDNVLLVHWHDLGRCLNVYGHPGVESPRVDQLAAAGILFTRAHATAPLCSPSRGSLFTGRYPHSNGLMGLAHHGWEYRAGVRTLPQMLGAAGWYSALFGMQHETSYPVRLGFDEFDVSNSYCEHVVPKAQAWLTESAPFEDGDPFLLTAGFFETHRPYPRDRYEPAATSAVEVPDYLPDIPAVRGDLAAFYGAIEVADTAVGRLLDTLSETGLDASTWVVFMTDHGPAFPRAKSTLYEAGTGIALIIRPPARLGIRPRSYDELFSGVDLVPTLLGLLGVDVPADVEGMSHADNLLRPAGDVAPIRDHVYTEKTYHDSFDPIRAIRTKEYSYIENYARRPLVDLPWDIEESPSGKAVEPFVNVPRPERELYDLREDPAETDNLLIGGSNHRAEVIANELAVRLHDWRVKTGDVIPSEFAGTRISIRYTETYLSIHGLTPTSRSAIAAQRGIEEEVKSKQ